MKLMGVGDDVAAKSLNGFTYSHIDMSKLGATEYTIVQIVTDKTGSVADFQKELEAINKTCVASCQKSPRAENLLIRSTAFDSPMGGRIDIEELHGFTLLSAIDPNKYDGAIEPRGMTPLFDATMEGVDALDDYARKLFDQQYTCNAIMFVVTDGGDNSSNKATPEKIKKAIKKIKKDEILESFTIILIGVNTVDCGTELAAFNTEAEFDQYVEIENATPQGLAKLAKFVSKSVSSTSQSLGTGTSQPVDFSKLTI